MQCRYIVLLNLLCAGTNFGQILDYIVFEELTYTFSEDVLDFAKARSKCKTSGDLALTKQKQLVNQLQEKILSFNASKCFYIGLIREEKDRGIRDHTWVDGSVYNYATQAFPWHNKYAISPSSGNRCVCVRQQDSRTAAMQEVNCTESFNYICQRPTSAPRTPVTLSPSDGSGLTNGSSSLPDPEDLQISKTIGFAMIPLAIGIAAFYVRQRKKKRPARG